MSGDGYTGDSALQCECCGYEWPDTVKYKGLGYYCYRCAMTGCLGDDTDAQNPSGKPPYYVNRDRIHAEMRAERTPE